MLLAFLLACLPSLSGRDLASLWTEGHERNPQTLPRPEWLAGWSGGPYGSRWVVFVPTPVGRQVLDTARAISLGWCVCVTRYTRSFQRKYCRRWTTMIVRFSTGNSMPDDDDDNDNDQCVSNPTQPNPSSVSCCRTLFLKLIIIINQYCHATIVIVLQLGGCHFESR